MKLWISILTLWLGLMSAATFAQQGHPLSGTWQGEWGSDNQTQHFLTLIMEWDGQAISGSANPGPEATRIDSVVLDSSDWSVTIDMELKDDEGNSLRWKAHGMLENLGSQTRTLNGTWEGKGEHGSFTLTRQSGA